MLAWQQSWLFGNPLDLYEATLAANRDALAGTFLHYNVGILLAQQGRLQEAEEHYQTALKLMPDNTLAMMGLGEILFSKRIDR